MAFKLIKPKQKSEQNAFFTKKKLKTSFSQKFEHWNLFIYGDNKEKLFFQKYATVPLLIQILNMQFFFELRPLTITIFRSTKLKKQILWIISSVDNACHNNSSPMVSVLRQYFENPSFADK